MKRIYHPWNKWEDYRCNFYGGVGTFDKTNSLQTYASLLSDLPRFESALKTIIDEWRHSCEHNLSNESMNRVAYLGQASCALVYNVPHNVCMGGYNLLTDEQKAAADAMALKYLNIWLTRMREENVSS